MGVRSPPPSHSWGDEKDEGGKSKEGTHKSVEKGSGGYLGHPFWEDMGGHDVNTVRWMVWRW